jgi:hypothetical protein
VLVNFSRALTHGTQHYYGAWLGTTEFTNPFLSLTFGCMRFDMMESLTLKVATVALILSFFFLRVLSLPWCFAIHVSDVAATMTGKDPPGSVLDDHRIFFALGTLSIVFLWALSTWWFSKMVKGVLRRSKAASAAEEKQKSK